MLEALTRTTPGSEAGDLLGAFFIADAYFRAVGMMLWAWFVPERLAGRTGG